MNYLACDLGAESGRLMLGRIEDGRISLEEIHRFPNVPIKVNGSLCWDIEALWDELQSGFRKASQCLVPIHSISADSWGLDYVLLDGDDRIIEPTFHYRDVRTAHGVENLKTKIGWPAL